ncbi:MAG TPA: NlpC/P60 family protein [Mycobacterium sp.]|nr:NlpC/P60 family protein [Mycobacterium sp.]
MSRAPSPAVSESVGTELAGYVGVPYLEHGRTPAGWDCYGLVYYLSRRYLHHAVPSYSLSYTDANSADDAFAEHVPEWQRLTVGEAEPGDVLVLNCIGLPVHCALVVGAGTMLHCMRGRATVLERFTSAAWSRRIEGAYRWTS